MKHVNRLHNTHYRKPKLRFLYLLSVILFLSSCTASSNMPETFSEGAETSVEVIGYHTAKTADYFLKEGDRVAVISPSAYPSEKQRDAVMNGLRDLGYIPVEGSYTVGEERTLQQTAEDLKWALEDPEIKAIYCIRGGTASSEVIDYLGVKTIAANPKLIIGYSDISAYLAAWTSRGLPSLHSSMAGSFINLPEACLDAQKHMMRGEIPTYQCEGMTYDVQGEAEGILLGGNLSVLLSVLGTDYDPTGIDQPYILFLEDTAEDMEHIHRMLTVLKHMGILDRAQGILFGEWSDIPAECETYDGRSRGGRFQGVADMISRQFTKDLGIPVAFGFPAGHGDMNYPLLMGQKVRLTVETDHYTLEWE